MIPSARRALLVLVVSILLVATATFTLEEGVTIFGSLVIDDDAFEDRVVLGGVRGALRRRCSSMASSSSSSAVDVVTCDLVRLVGDGDAADDVDAAAVDAAADFLPRALIDELTDMMI